MDEVKFTLGSSGLDAGPTLTCVKSLNFIDVALLVSTVRAGSRQYAVSPFTVMAFIPAFNCQTHEEEGR